MLELRRGYRNVYTFQRRMFDRLADLSDTLGRMGFEFDRWDPSHYARPARSTSEFLRRPYWAWDLLPSYALPLAWQAPAGKNGVARRLGVEMEPDTGFTKPPGGEPNPSDFTTAESADSLLSLSLFRLTDPRVAWSQAWQLLSRIDDLYDGQDHVAAAGAGQCVYQYFRVKLADILDQAGLQIHVVKSLLL